MSVPHDIEHRTKKDIVYQYLKDAIIDRRWKPGEKKSFVELSELLKVSRTPVSEACKLLEKEGWLLIRPQVGVEAAYLSKREIEENYKIRGALEGLAGLEAVKNLTEKDIANLETMLEEMEKFETNDNFGPFYDVNREFHRYIYNASKMENLISTIERFWDSGRRYRFFYRHIPNALMDSNFYHKKIISGLKARDSKVIRDNLEKDSWVFGEKLYRYLEIGDSKRDGF